MIESNSISSCTPVVIVADWLQQHINISLSIADQLQLIFSTRRVLMKESSRGTYNISPYMIANSIVFLPFLFTVVILFVVPVYWIVGLNPSIAAFAFFAFVVWLIVLMASSLMFFPSAISPDFTPGNSLIYTVLGAFFLFSRYFIPNIGCSCILC